MFIATLGCCSILALSCTSSRAGARLTIVGNSPADRFGAALAGVGDLDGDGRSDLVIGAPRAVRGGNPVGAAQVISGADGRVLLRWSGTSTGARLGQAVAGAGDVNADGVPDVLVGAPLDGAVMGGASGRAFVFCGQSGRTLWSFSGAAAGDRFGEAVSGAGDVDDDGHDDVLIGAPYADVGGAQAGGARVYSGRTGALLLAFDGSAWDFLGYAVSAAGDLDGDGCDDVLIGAPFSDVGSFNAGSAFVRSGRDGSLLLAVHGTEVGAQLGSALRGGGDVDGDGVPDLLLGAPGADAGSIDAGAVEVRAGAGGGLLFTVVGGASGEGLFACDFAGDVDGDGHEDLLAGAPSADGSGAHSGRARLVSGQTGTDLAVYVGRSTRD